MNIPVPPISQVKPGWGLDERSITSFVSNDSGGYPEVLAAQTIIGAAFAGIRVVLLLPGHRDDDLTWQRIVALLAGGDRKTAAETLHRLPIEMHSGGSGLGGSDRANLVYAPGLTTRELRHLREQTDASILVVGKDFGEESIMRSVGVIRVGSDALVIDAEGIEVPVVFDPSGPIYCPA
jgi:hypothetical protein